MPRENPVRQRIKRMFTSSEWMNNASISQDVASLFIPRRANILDTKMTGTEVGWYDHIIEPAPMEIARTLAQGQYDLLFTGDWFEAMPPMEEPTDSQEKAYSEVGKRMRDTIDGSNFKLEVQEFLSDRSTVHTAVVMCDEDKEDTIFFMNQVPGKYAIAEDYKKRVDTLARKLPLTARQIKQKFNKSTDNIPDKVLKAIEDGKHDRVFEVEHLVEPRDPDDVVKGSDNPKKMPYSSVYMLGGDTIRSGGYREQPFFASRFDRWGDSPYGTGPAHVELSRARSLQKMRQAHIALGDRLTNPGLFVSPHQEDAIKPFGVTVVSREDNAAGLPREWNTTARYDVTIDVIDREIAQMEEVFFVPLFKLLMNDTDREKTAFEVQKMLEEKIGRAAPTFSRLDSEVMKPLLSRVFNIMLRAGKFDDILEDLLVIDPETGEEGVGEPMINFTSKLAQAMRAVRSNSVIQFVQSMAGVTEFKPEVMDNTNWNLTYRRMWKDAGNPAEELRDLETVEDDQEQMKAAQQAMVAGQIADTTASAGQKAGM